MTVPHTRTAHSGDGLRILRAAVFSAVCLVLAAAGHAMASCATVPLWTLGAGFLGTLVAVLPFAGRARSLPGIAALLAVGQTVLHLVFELGRHGTAAMSPSDAGLAGQAARLVGGSPAAALGPAQAHRILADAQVHDGGMTGMHHATDALADSSSAALPPSLPMVLAHVLAGVAAGWVLRRSDLALLRLIDLSAHGVAEGALVRSLRAALTLVRALRAGLPGTPGSRPARTALFAPPAVLRTTTLQHTVVRRGPPAANALVLAA